MLSTKKTKTLEPQGFLPAAVLASYLVIHLNAAYTKTARHSQTPTRCMGHSSRYQRLNPSKGSMGFGGLYTVILPCAAAAVNVASPTGFEPVAYSLEGCCSILLS